MAEYIMGVSRYVEPKAEGKYAEVYKKYIKKMAIVGEDIEARKEKDLTYKLMRYNTDAEVIALPECFSGIAMNAFENCRNVKQIIFPSTLRSLKTSIHYGLEKYNIPSKVVGIHRTTYEEVGSLTVKLEGCIKSVQAFAFWDVQDLNIIESQLIGRINQAGFRNSNIRELRLIKTLIQLESFASCSIKTLYISKHTKVSPRSFRNCNIDNVYVIVQNEMEGKQLQELMKKTDIFKGAFDACRLNSINITIKPNLGNMIDTLR